MSDHTSIEWADATLDVSQRDALEKAVVRPPTSRLQPLPNISIPLAAVATDASRDDVCGLGDAAVANWSYVVPCLGRLGAVGARVIELLQKQRAGESRNRLNTPFAPSRMRPAAKSIVLTLSIAPSRFRVSARLADALPSNVRQGLPLGASTAPAQTGPAHRLAFRFRWSFGFSCLPAFSTKIAHAVEARTVGIEPVRRSVLTALAAPLLSVLAARDEPTVGCSNIFMVCHAL